MQAQPLETHPADTQSLMAEIGRAARRGARAAALAPSAVKDAALRAAAREIRLASAAILAANALDVEAARAAGASSAALDRLTLDPKRIEAMARGVEEIADLPDPVGRVLAVFERPNGLRIERVTTPLGVIGVIYESRPNVTADAGALCLKSGNATILRGGSDSPRSSAVIHRCLVAGLEAAGLPAEAIALVPTTDRAAVGAMLAGLDGDIDVIVPRGGKSLVARVQHEARVPVFAHLEGIVHVYVHGARRSRNGQKDRAQRQDAAHGRLRRGGDAAGRPRLRRDASGAACRHAARGGLRGARRRGDAGRRSARDAGERTKTGTRNISTPSSPCASSTGSTTP